MKTVYNWGDLSPFGINLLTGEACAYGMRYLCDVSETGARAVREMFGLPHGAPLAENWNSGTGNPTGPSVGSVMIPYDCFRQLAVFCLFADGACAVTVTNGSVDGYYPDDDPEAMQRHIDISSEVGGLIRTYSPIGGARVGSRMTHAMSERTV